MIEYIWEHWAAFSCGLAVGSCMGVFVMALCAMAGRTSMCEDCDYIVRGEGE
jgi:hypothetical protein